MVQELTTRHFPLFTTMNHEQVSAQKQQTKPLVSRTEVEILVRKLYGLQVTSVQEFNSYLDRCFLVTVANTESLPDVRDRCGHGYILKIFNTIDSKLDYFVQAQAQMMQYFQGRSSFASQRPVKNVYGKLSSLVKILSKQYNSTVVNFIREEQDKKEFTEHMVMLLTYVPGELLRNIEFTANILFQAGVMAAKIASVFKDFRNEALEKAERRWNLTSLPQFKSFLYVIRNEEHRVLARQVIDSFESRILPIRDQFTRNAIHGDLNDQNILVEEIPNEPGKYRLSGIIDFGNAHFTCGIFELAIAICYLMIESTTIDALEAPGHIIAGYVSMKEISELEFQNLKVAIAGRMCQTLVHGAYMYSLNAEPHLLTTSRRGWDCLKRFWPAPEDQLYQKWRQIVTSYSL